MNSVPSSINRIRKRKTILVVDDEPRMIGFIRMVLELEDYQVIEAHCGLEALDALRTQLPDLVLLDVMMPDLDVFETLLIDVMMPDLDSFKILRVLREFSEIPVIMLAARGEENAIGPRFNLGAGDYITKPFGPRELSSPIKAIFRRLEMPSIYRIHKRKTILIVDDEPRIIGFLRQTLELEDYEVIEAHSGLEALDVLHTQLPDLILLDHRMPDLAGIETLRMLREFYSIPVIMLAEKCTDVDIIVGFHLGADDYITKPFRRWELSCRIEALFRRLEEPSTEEAMLRIDDRLCVDFNQRQVIVDGEAVKLRRTEYRFLYHLIRNTGWTVPHDQKRQYLDHVTLRHDSRE